ncbi:MAG: ABC transporter ATP-binding protein [Porphyromonadaceae bacterium]|nr:MAG: ABC transporter ATP-binding protein [Porphyromonadaceae bacterium]
MKTFFQIIRRYIYPYRSYVVLNLVFNLFGVIFSLLSLILIGPFLRVLFGDAAITSAPGSLEFTRQSIEQNFNYLLSQLIEKQGPHTALIVVSVIAIALFFLKTANIYFANFFMAPVRNGVVRDLRNQIYSKIIELPLSYYSREKKGDIMSRLTQDVQEVEWSVMASLEKFFRDPLNILIFLIGMFIMSPTLTLIVLLILPISAFLIGTVGRNLRKISSRSQNQMGMLMSMVEETLSGLRIIKAFNAQEQSEKNFQKENQIFTRIMNAITRHRDLASPLSEFLGSLVVVGLMAFGGNLVLQGQGALSAASFIAYIAVFSQLLIPAKSVSTAYYHLNKGLASIDRINQVLQSENPMHEEPNPLEINSFNDKIELNNVSFSYENTVVINDVSLTIHKGETIAFVGQSGSGKSTLVDLMARFYDVGNGEILIDGKNVRKVNTKALRNLMGIVPQDPVLFNDTILSNIAFGSVPDAALAETAAKVAHAWEFIIQMEEGLDSHLGDRGSTLSGGQRQRICLARAIYRNPPILILDEATSSLDSESENYVQASLQDLMKNRTTIIIAHRLSSIQNADRIYVIKEGQVAEKGTHSELMNLNGEYRYLFELQNHGIQ